MHWMTGWGRSAVATRLAALSSCALALGAVGCDGLRYVGHLLDGQFAIEANTEPIDQVLASGRLSEADAAKLRLVVEARQFAIDQIGLSAGQSYTTFHDTEGKPLVYNLSASRKDALVAYEWSFPIVGSFPYIGFFDEAYLNEVEQDLIDQGYDTFTYQPDAYSTLGLRADPVRSPMLKRDDVSLIDTIIHEVLHNTIWRPNDFTFNETMATFVGRQGAVEFLERRGAAGQALIERARARYADDAKLNDFLISLFNELKSYYDQPGDREAKIAGREAVFERGRERFRTSVQPTLSRPEAYNYYAELPANNAFILLFARYNYDLSKFEAVYAATGRSWPRTLEVFRGAARAGGDPFAYLDRWLAENAPASQPAVGG
ncbi:MAG: aminopeptidase [Phycisphaerae bacterium]|nr:aminopeptidase [Phycisphaerae bacterium]